jgi:hypothetical protein
MHKIRAERHNRDNGQRPLSPAAETEKPVPQTRQQTVVFARLPSGRRPLKKRAAITRRSKKLLCPFYLFIIT